MIKLLLACLLLFFSTTGSAQQTDSLRFTKLGMENGLPDSKVSGIAEDADGFLWIGTSNGLSRYDGTEFRNFFHSNKANSLAGNNIVKMLNYDSSHLLIATTTGLSLLNTRTLQFKNFVVRSSALMFSRDNSYRSIAIDDKKNIWAGSRTSVYCLSPELKILKRFVGYTEQDYNTSRMLYVYDIVTLPGNEVLIRLEERETWAGIYYIFNSQADTLQSLKQLPQHPLHIFTEAGTGTLTNDAKGNLHYLKYLSDSISIYDVHTKQFRYTRLYPQDYDSLRGYTNVNVRVLDAGGNMMVCALYADGGLALLPSDYMETPHKQLKPTVYFKGELINAACLSRDGNLWIGGSTGLYTSTTRSANIQSGTVAQYANHSLALDQIDILHDSIYVAAEFAGFFVFDKNCHYLDNIVLRGTPYITSSWFAMQGPSRDTVWLSTQVGLRWYHPRTKTYGLVQVNNKPKVVDEVAVTVRFSDSKGLDWMGLGFGHGLTQYDPVTRSMKYYPTSGAPNAIPIRYPLAIDEDYQGNLWMGNHDGVALVRWRRNDDRFDMIKPNYYGTFDNAEITALYCGRKEVLWIATHSGLFRYHIPSQQMTKLTVADGLPSASVTSITADDKGRLWIGTTNGLCCLYPKERKFVNFMHPSSLPQPGIGTVIFDSASKKIYFTTSHYLNTFNPDDLLAHHAELNIQITGVQIGNKETPIQPYYNISYDQNDISFSFTAINFANGRLNKYYYQLDGKEWVALGHQRQVNFLNLSPGNYSFSLKAVNSAGTWSDEVTIQFTIRRAWWQSWWFRIAALAAIAAIVFFAVKRRITGIRHVAEMRQKIAETEMMALRAQMNPHFIFNCINSIDALILSNDKYHATMYLNKFAKLLRNVLDSSKQNSVPLTKDLETLQLYIDLEKLRDENKFSAEIITEPLLLQDDFKVPALIVQPYVENAIIHGLKHRRDNKGRVTINVSKQHDYIEYIIEDNGVGRNTARNSMGKDTSYGMQMTRDRVKFFNNEEHASVVVTDLENNGEPAGTRVQVLLKIQ